jgi:prepilin-type N-terminal cleavage/methylation domain-containing protein
MAETMQEAGAIRSWKRRTDGAADRCAHRCSIRSRSAYTLVEILIVLAILVLVLSIVGPGVTTMWNQRLESQSDTVVIGALRSVRMQARNSGERGLLFFVNEGRQQIVVIEPLHRMEIRGPGGSLDAVIDQPNGLADCFRIVEGTVFNVPDPYRVTPLDVVRTPSAWSGAELSNEKAVTDDLSGNNNTNQRHRNFFSVVFGPDGRMRVGRNVLIYDPQGRTGMVTEDVARYFNRVGVPVAFPGNLPSDLRDMVSVGNQHTAVNFPSVDGLLVYDDAMFREFPPAGQREFLRKNALPYYISPAGGEVLRGPVGE